MKGMNAINLATGMYGTRGERIRHVVHEGSLRLPIEALQILLQPSGLNEGRPTNAATQVPRSGSSHKKGAASAQLPPAWQLPGLDSVVRPSIDAALGSITVTELCGMPVLGNPDTQAPATTRTVARNRIAPTPLGRVVAVAASTSATSAGEAERIRGGGGEGEPGAVRGTIPSSSGGSQEGASIGSGSGGVVQPVDAASVGATATLSVAPQQSIPTAVSSAPSAVGSPRVVAPPTKPVSMVPGGPVPTPALSMTGAGSAAIVTARPPPAAQPTITVTTSGIGTAPAPSLLPSAGTSTPSQAPTTTTPIPAAASTPVKPVSAPAPAPAAAPTVPPPPLDQQVISLQKRPAPQWEQHIPGPNDEMQVDPANKTPVPEWYTPKTVSELEKTVLYEWFDWSAPHRTPATYLYAREAIREMADKLGNRYITTTLIRRAIPGDVSSLMRLHSFLTTYSLINEDSQNDSAPTPASLQDDKLRGTVWNPDLRDRLLEAVVDQSRKRPKLESPADVATSTGLTIDWAGVAEQVGGGATAKECEQHFLALPLQPDASAAERSITPDASSTAELRQDEAAPTKTEPHSSVVITRAEALQEVVDSCDPDVACAITEAALRLSGGSLAAAQKAGAVGVLAARAAEEARSHEDAVAHLLSEIVDLRMKKLENRLSLLDDVEGMLEAERVALELERRDLYTARCRHWFGGP